MSKKFWDTEEVIAVVQKTEKTEVRISKCTKDGDTIISIREWYHTNNDPTKKPGKNGINIPANSIGDKISASIVDILMES
jgi:hypothetical protein